VTTWDTTAQAILDAMVASGVEVSRQLISGANAGRRCRQHLVYPDTPGVAPQSLGQLPGGGCVTLAVLRFRAVFTADCAPGPGDQGQQPDPDEMTAWYKQFLADCDRVWQSLVEHSATFGEGCDSVSFGDGEFTGPTGGIASMSVPISVQPPAPLDTD
jgi:hypothetical protein